MFHARNEKLFTHMYTFINSAMAYTGSKKAHLGDRRNDFHIDTLFLAGHPPDGFCNIELQSMGRCSMIGFCSMISATASPMLQYDKKL